MNAVTAWLRRRRKDADDEVSPLVGPVLAALIQDLKDTDADRTGEDAVQRVS
jgi:hypothetical protein